MAIVQSKVAIILLSIKVAIVQFKVAIVTLSIKVAIVIFKVAIITLSIKLAIVTIKVAITLSVIMEVITIIIQTLIEMEIRTHDMVLRIAIHHRSSAMLTIARLGCIMIVIIIMDAALMLKQKKG